MAFFVVTHKVDDFDAWKKVYEAHDETRAKFGVTDHYVLQAADDPNHISVIGECPSDKVQDFFNSVDLKTAMQEAGLSGPPELFIGENRL